MARIATRIITPTESVRRELCEHLRVNPAKVVTVPDAARRIFKPMSQAEAVASNIGLGVTGDFLLAVGTLEPRKNLLTLIRAFEDLVNTSRPAKDVSLVIAGKTGWLTEGLFAHVASSSLRDRILFTGYITDTQLRALYSTCVAFIYPSLYEGFGLPPLEAMSCGAPVIAARIPSLIEILGEEAAILVPPTDTQALARSLKRLLDDQETRQRLLLAGPRRAAEFTWERTARETLDVYQQILRAPKD
jgi:glycosyltransferase involved in cell wall biosynthesis